MDAQHTEAIVLRRQPVTETSLIVTWFSRDHGKLKTIAKGARRFKGPFLGRIDLFYRDELVFLRSRRTDLHVLHECYVLNAHAELRVNPGVLAAASYACELVELGTEIEDPNPGIYELLGLALDALGRHSPSVTLIWFEMRLLAVLGWQPRWTECTPASKVLDSLAATSINAVSRVRLSDEQLGAARAELWRFWDEHLDAIPRSRRLLPPQ